MTNRTDDKIHLSDELIARLNIVITGNLGLYFPDKHRDELCDKFFRASQKFGFTDAQDCIRWLSSAPLTQEQVEILSLYLTVTETHFFRDNSFFEGLEKHVLPDLISTGRSRGNCLRIWSAGCASGEEPYSLAILLSRMLPDIAGWNISILATDINPGMLEKARKGIYGKWSFRNTPDWLQEEYFSRTKGDSMILKPAIRDMVTFSFHNLVRDPFPLPVNGTIAIDLILCRNVIMYFHTKFARKLIDRFYRTLRDKGWLALSGSEGFLAHKSRFVTVVCPESVFFRKDSSLSGTMEVQPEKKDGSVYHENLSVNPGLLSANTLTFPELPDSQLIDTKWDNIRQIQVDSEIKEMEQMGHDPVETATRLYEKGNYPEAEGLLSDHLLNDQNNAAAVVLLVKIFSNQGKLNEAMEWCRRGMDIDKCNPEYYYLLALIFLEQGRTEEAISSLKSSIYLEGDHVLSHYMLGYILFQKGDRNKAGKYFSNVLNLLAQYDKESILPGSDGLSAGKLTEIVRMKCPPGNVNPRSKNE